MLFDQGVKSKVWCHTDLTSSIAGPRELMGKLCKCGKEGGSFHTVSFSSDHTHSIKKYTRCTQMQTLAASPTGTYHSQICLSLLLLWHTHLASCLHEGNRAWLAMSSLGQRHSMLLPHNKWKKKTISDTPLQWDQPGQVPTPLRAPRLLHRYIYNSFPGK